MAPQPRSAPVEARPVEDSNAAARDAAPERKAKRHRPRHRRRQRALAAAQEGNPPPEPALRVPGCPRICAWARSQCHGRPPTSVWGRSGMLPRRTPMVGARCCRRARGASPGGNNPRRALLPRADRSRSMMAAAQLPLLHTSYRKLPPSAPWRHLSQPTPPGEGLQAPAVRRHVGGESRRRMTHRESSPRCWFTHAQWLRGPRPHAVAPT